MDDRQDRSPDFYHIVVSQSLPRNPRLHAIATRCGVPVNEAMGAVISLWIWVEQYGEVYERLDAVVPGATTEMLDDIGAVIGLAEAMIAVTWLRESDDGSLVFPGFYKTHGRVGRQRVRDRLRKRRERAEARFDLDADHVVERV